MKFKKLFDGTKIPSMGIGTWGVGGKTDPEKSEEKKYINAINYAISKGLTHIDTAEFYTNGYTEEIIGKAIKKLNRKNLFITSKVWKTNLKYNDLIDSLRGSLKRLNINYLDSYLIHWPNINIALKETIEALNYLKDNGLIKHIGVSNFSLELLIKAESYSKNKISIVQSEYNLTNKRVEKDLLPYCQKNNIIFTAYSPLAKGNIIASNIKILKQLEEKYKKTQAQIVLNWLISKENVITIPKATNISHINENIEALNFKIDKEDIKKLDKF